MEKLRENIIYKQADTVKYQQRRAIHRVRKLVGKKSRVGHHVNGKVLRKTIQKSLLLKAQSCPALVIYCHNNTTQQKTTKSQHLEQEHLIFPQASELDWLSFMSARWPPSEAHPEKLQLLRVFSPTVMAKAQEDKPISTSVLQTSALIMSTYIPLGQSNSQGQA